MLSNQKLMRNRLKCLLRGGDAVVDADAGNVDSGIRLLVDAHGVRVGHHGGASGDIGNLPSGFVQDAAAVVGKTLRNSIGPGQVLRSDQIMAALVIRQGQNVKVISTGSGFSVTAEGKAVANATIGQLVQVKMPSGQTITGTARADGSVEISF